MHFLKIPGLAGEATDAEHPGWIPLIDVKFAGDPAATGPGEVTVRKRIDKTSAQLADASPKRTNFPSVLIDVQTGTNRTGRISLEDVHISMIAKHEGGAGSNPKDNTEDVTLAYARRTPQPTSENELRLEKKSPPPTDKSYLQVPGVPGDATDPGHNGWIELISFQASERADVVETGPGQRKLSNPSSSLKVTKLADRASPELKAAREWQSLVIDTVGEKTTHQTTFDHPVIVSIQQLLVGADGAKGWGEEVVFTFERHSEKSTENPAGTKRGDAPGGPTKSMVFIQLPGITGESQDPGHAGWIEFTSVDRLDAEPAKTAEEHVGERRSPVILPTSDGQTGKLTASRLTDNDTQKLLAAFQAQQHFDWAVVDIVTASGTQQIKLEDVSIIMFGQLRDGTGQSCTFNYERHKAAPIAKPGKQPSSHPVVRANSTAATERSTINLRPPKFFEIALPVLNGENGKRVYPAADATLRLTSQKGYDQSRPISEGMITDDQYCSFRFFDISEKAVDELFTATLERGGEKETIFKDRKVATYIRAARQQGAYETTFAPAPAAPSAAPRDELLAPLVGEGAPA